VALLELGGEGFVAAPVLAALVPVEEEVLAVLPVVAAAGRVVASLLAQAATAIAPAIASVTIGVFISASLAEVIAPNRQAVTGVNAEP
jgi:Mg2+/citrate symporter